MKINPFKPNYPVPHGLFVGRSSEIKRLQSQFLQTRAGQPTNFVITGERGIGKSSLLLFAKFIATGGVPINGKKLNFLVIDTDIDSNTSQLGLVKKIELGLRRELGESESARKFLSDAWSFIKRCEVAGVKINKIQESKLDETALEEFSYSLADICKRVTGHESGKTIFSSSYDGILILIDEADNSPPTLDLGSFFKLLTERLQRRGCNNVMVGLAGLPEIRNILLSSHPSSLRIFEEIRLERLSEPEVNSVIDICLSDANKKNSTPTTITNEARKILVKFSEGYPHFIQQFGYCAFAVDKDDNIDTADCFDGALGKGGAMELIGDRYYRDKFYNKIQKESYRQVLRIMAEKGGKKWITKKEIRSKFRGKETVLNNAIKALRDRHIIISKEGVIGVYGLQYWGFALWIKLYTTDPEQLKLSLENAEAKSQ